MVPTPSDEASAPDDDSPHDDALARDDSARDVVSAPDDASPHDDGSPPEDVSVPDDALAHDDPGRDEASVPDDASAYDDTSAPGDPPQFRAVAERMAVELDDDASGHGVHHAWRVFRLGQRLAAAEGADPEVVGAAALVHDLHRVMGGEEYVHPEETLDMVREVLEDAGFPGEKIPAVQHCVAVHEEYGFDYGPDSEAAETVEAAVLQDADNLDAIGAVGVARAFMFAGAREHPAWMPERDVIDWSDHDDVGSTGDGGPADGVESTDEGVDRDTSLVDGLVDAEGGVLSHFEDKLLHLREDVNTEAGRALAEERHAFLVEFVERFRREWFAEA